MENTILENNLRYHLELTLPRHSIKEVYNYAILPAGKLFRPHLVWSILKDINPSLFNESLNNKFAAHALFASAVEFHHCYTLLHDDLPCMDNDTLRRGKTCTHLVYGEWKALLAGDGLLNISYQLLCKIKNKRAHEIMTFFSWALGPKGLIHGQVLDLSHEMSLNFENISKTHELKTSRLIQVAILGSALLSTSKDRILEKKLWRFSKLLGINFQFIDDLTELCDENISIHEKSINPWLQFQDKTSIELKKNLLEFNKLALDLNLKNTNKIIKKYYLEMSKKLVSGKQEIEKHLKKENDISPIVLLLNSFCQ